MISKMKPYRLINTTELNHLQELVNERLRTWSDEYALNPLSGKLSKIQPFDREQFILVKENHRPVALMTHNHLSVIKHSLVSDLDDCFNSLAETLLLTLLTRLFAVKFLSLQTNLDSQLDSQMQDWIYVGTPSHTLTISLKNSPHQMMLHLHPDWILNALPSKKIIKESPSRLDDAIANQSMFMHVELKPVSLKLNDVLNLRVGDTLKTDHLTTEPIRLQHQNQSVCDVTLGKNKTHKSIQITRES